MPRRDVLWVDVGGTFPDLVVADATGPRRIDATVCVAPWQDGEVDAFGNLVLQAR